MLKDQFQYYLDYQEDLVKKYNNKVLVIKDFQVVEVCKSIEEAYFLAKKKYAPGSFIIQKCSSGEKDYTAVFHSRVWF